MRSDGTCLGSAFGVQNNGSQGLTITHQLAAPCRKGQPHFWGPGPAKVVKWRRFHSEKRGEEAVRTQELVRGTSGKKEELKPEELAQPTE